MSGVHVTIHEFDSNMQYTKVGPTYFPAFSTPPGTWKWRSYLHSVGDVSLDLHPNTTHVMIGFGAYVTSASIDYLDIDAVTVNVR